MDTKAVKLFREWEDAKRELASFRKYRRVAFMLNGLSLGVFAASVIVTFLVDVGYGAVWLNVFLALMFVASVLYTLAFNYLLDVTPRELTNNLIKAERAYNDYMLKEVPDVDL